MQSANASQAKCRDDASWDTYQAEYYEERCRCWTRKELALLGAPTMCDGRSRRDDFNMHRIPTHRSYI